MENQNKTTNAPEDRLKRILVSTEVAVTENMIPTAMVGFLEALYEVRRELKNLKKEANAQSITPTLKG